MDVGERALSEKLARRLRVDCIRATTRAGSGHPTSGMSAADLMAVLLAKHLRYDFRAPRNPANDHLVFSKGHASPLLYAMLRAASAITDEELLSYRQFGSRLQGHPTPALPWVEVATGSLGQGLPIAVGIALAGRRVEKADYRVWVLLGDSELAEGSVWEAFEKAANYELSNLTAIVDVNRLGQRGPTAYGWNLDVYRRRVEAFGCHVLTIDGHDVEAIDEAFERARSISDRPTVILAKTVKGKGVAAIEDKAEWHGKALSEEMAARAIEELGGEEDVHVSVRPPSGSHVQVPSEVSRDIAMPTYARGAKVATRKAFGEALAALGALPDVVVLDAEVSNSTFTELFAKAHPERFFQMFIAEQQLVAAAVGMSVRGLRPFAATFAAFLSRAYDFLRMAAVSRANIRLSGSHAGVEIGPDGPSQMGLEDLAMMRAVFGSTVLYPSDATSTAALVGAMAEREGVVYLRTTRGAHPVLYEAGESFPIGGSKTLRASEDDDVALLGAGVTVYECLRAAEILETRGVRARVLDLYSVKPIDDDALREAVRATGGRIVVAEDHYPEGGLGSAVLEALALEPSVRLAHRAVRDLPGSGAPEELMDAAGITAPHIAEAALELVERPAPAWAEGVDFAAVPDVP